jgi:hypothetical protein
MMGVETAEYPLDVVGEAKYFLYIWVVHLYEYGEELCETAGDFEYARYAEEDAQHQHHSLQHCHPHNDIT